MWAMTIRQSGAYRHLEGRVNGLLAESGQTSVQKLGGGCVDCVQVSW
jgi:hypothetical protein